MDSNLHAGRILTNETKDDNEQQRKRQRKHHSRRAPRNRPEARPCYGKHRLYLRVIFTIQILVHCQRITNRHELTNGNLMFCLPSMFVIPFEIEILRILTQRGPEEDPQRDPETTRL